MPGWNKRVSTHVVDVESPISQGLRRKLPKTKREKAGRSSTVLDQLWRKHNKRCFVMYVKTDPSFSRKRSQGSLEKWLNPGLGQGKLKMSLEQLVITEISCSKTDTKTSKGHRSQHEGAPHRIK